jgi:methylthioribose-1-phosphate isomerase
MSENINDLLPFILKRENIARYEDGQVVICDRRKYPFEKSFYRCPDVETAARAIEEMVTQGAGPSITAAYAMVIAAREAESKRPEDRLEHLRQARERLAQTRPTNTAIALRLNAVLEVLENANTLGQPLAETLLDWIESFRDRMYKGYAAAGRNGASLIADGDGVLTMCFAEAWFILSMSMAAADGKNIRVFVPETRPYLQGARLAAPCVHELGIPVQIITDNMPAYVMSQGKIQKYMTAADLVTLDGHVVNKIGTFQNAVTANYHGIPYFVFCWGLDLSKPDRDSVVIEERDPQEIRSCRGQPTTIPEIDAYYPAFDITPPHLISGVVVSTGIFSPYDLKNNYDKVQMVI